MGWGGATAAEIANQSLTSQIDPISCVFPGRAGELSCAPEPPTPPPQLGLVWFEWRQTLDILRIKNKLSEIIEDEEE